MPQSGVVPAVPEALHGRAGTAPVEDERHCDRFDRACGRYLQQVSSAAPDVLEAVISEDWLRRACGREWRDEDKAKLRQIAALDELMKKFAKRPGEQHQRREDGNRWIGTGGGRPGGVRGGGASRNHSVAGVWEQRSFRDLDGDAGLIPRNLKLALRRLRRFAREGAVDGFDLHGTHRRHCAPGRRARRAHAPGAACSTCACARSGATRSA